MKKLGIILTTLLIGIGVITTSAFAYFNFSTDSSTKNNTNTKDNYINNIKFDLETKVDTDRTYELYFFASPYYSTGLESDDITNGYTSSTLTDPLEIAESSDNSYNSQTDYPLCPQKLPEGSSKYGNIKWSSTAVYHVSVPNGSINEDALNSDGCIVDVQGTQTVFTKFYQKRHFSGFINLLSDIEDIEIGNSSNNAIESKDDSSSGFDNIFTYVKLTVKGGITSDVLSQIIAQTTFKDRYGFGPEFMGWTYDKEASFNRTVYNTGTSDSPLYTRYTQGSGDNTMTLMKTNGYGMGDGTTVNQIGNYGDMSSIDLLSSKSSLYTIDSSSSDGSAANDHKIYLYPVFGSKNSIKYSSSDSSQKPILKMRTNADLTIDSDGDYTYEYDQTGEIDYSNNRYTTIFDYVDDADISNGEPNYQIKNFYVDTTSTSNTYQLDVNLINSGGGWGGDWNTLLNTSDLANLGFYDSFYQNYKGYFDIDMIFSQSEFEATSLIYPEMYINKLEVKSQTITNSDGTFTVYYIIGIKRNNSLSLTGVDSSDNIFIYNSSNDTILYEMNSTFARSSESTYWKYFTSNPVDLISGQNISLMIKEALKVKDTHDLDEFKGMDSDLLNYFNNIVEASSSSNKEKFVSAFSTTSSSGLSYYREDVTALNPDDTSTTLTVPNFPYLTSNREGTYEILVAIQYKDGFPNKFQVAFRDLTFFNLMILGSEPTQSTSYVYSEIYSEYKNNNLIASAGIFQRDTIIGPTTSFTTGSNIQTLLNSDTYKGKRIYDLATNEDVTDLLNSSKFVLSRNMILYFK